MPLSADILDDLHSFDPATMTWTLLFAADDTGGRPSARTRHGFTSAGGRIYVHGGTYVTDYGYPGEPRAREVGVWGEAGANAVGGWVGWRGPERGHPSQLHWVGMRNEGGYGHA